MNVNIDIMSAFFKDSLFDDETGTIDDNDIVWGIDKNTLGRGKHYNQQSSHLVWKLEEGRHTFWMESGNCDKKEVEFFIG